MEGFFIANSHTKWIEPINYMCTYVSLFMFSTMLAFLLQLSNIN